jgi:PBP1b-binding outer membrane lipoprotein LpoB
MNLKSTILSAITIAMLIAGCSKDNFNERDAIDAQKELLNLKYQHEIDLETLKQKGATALQELINAAALKQLKINDSLTTQNAINAKKQDYSVTVVDVTTNSPIVDADVTVSSQGKVYVAKTNAQGVASFTSLYLFPTSTFLVSKAGYAATQILQQNIITATAKLWNTTDLTNEISGSLYIDTDLTNTTAERVGENVLVTASTLIPGGPAEGYTVYYPTYSTAAGTYSLKLPAAPTGYTLTFSQIAADQKLYVNATEDDLVTTFPSSLPRVTTIKTYFNVNTYTATVPSVTNFYYFKFTADKSGRTLYLPGYNPNYGYNQVYLSAIADKFQVERLSTSNFYNSYPYTAVDINAFTFDANTKVDVEMVDVAGNLIQNAPKLAGTTNASGKLTSYYSQEGGSGYIHLKRDNAGALVANAKGVINKAVVYDTYNNLYTLNYSASLNTPTNRYTQNSYLLPNRGDKKVINFYYGSGDTREKQVY